MQKKKQKQKRKRRAYTAADLAELWDRWKRGESSKTNRPGDGQRSVGIHGAVALWRYPPTSTLPLASGVDGKAEREEAPEALSVGSRCDRSPAG